MHNQYLVWKEKKKIVACKQWLWHRYILYIRMLKMHEKQQHNLLVFLFHEDSPIEPTSPEADNDHVSSIERQYNFWHI